jgi:hypothetical protein
MKKLLTVQTVPHTKYNESRRHQQDFKIISSWAMLQDKIYDTFNDYL